MGFYDDMQAVGTELLTEFAQGTIVLEKAGVTAGPAWAPVAGVPTTITLKGVASGASRKYIDRGLAIGTDKQVKIAVPSVMPTMDDYLIIDGQRLKIQGVYKIPEAGTTVVVEIIAGTR